MPSKTELKPPTPWGSEYCMHICLPQASRSDVQQLLASGAASNALHAIQQAAAALEAVLLNPATGPASLEEAYEVSQPATAAAAAARQAPVEPLGCSGCRPKSHHRPTQRSPSLMMTQLPQVQASRCLLALPASSGAVGPPSVVGQLGAG